MGAIQGARWSCASPSRASTKSGSSAAAWSDPIRLNELIAAIDDVDSDGLDPHDYHVDALTAFRDELRSGEGADRIREQGDLDLIATDALALAMYHLYAGKVDPVKISAQWNFDQRPMLKSGDGIRVLGGRARVRPHRRGDDRMRADARRGTSSGASGCANIAGSRPPAAGPTIPAGPDAEAWRQRSSAWRCCATRLRSPGIWPRTGAERLAARRRPRPRRAATPPRTRGASGRRSRSRIR